MTTVAVICCYQTADRTYFGGRSNAKPRSEAARPEGVEPSTKCLEALQVEALCYTRHFAVKPCAKAP